MLGGYKVLAGEGVSLDFVAASRNPGAYSNPDSLHLRRFLKEGDEKPTLPFMAFGAPGTTHYCLGTSLARFVIKTTLATLLRDYQLTLDETQNKEYRNFPTYAPKSGVVIKDFRPRAVAKNE